MRPLTILTSLLLTCLSHTGTLRAEDVDDHWWGGFGTWQAPAPNGPLDALAVFNGDLIAGGNFSYPGGNPGDGYVSRWDGTRWWQLGNGIGDDPTIPGNSIVRDLEVYNGDLIVAGWFKYANGWLTGFRVNNTARWDGTNWHSMGLGVNDIVYMLTTYDGYLIASGLFTQAGGSPADYIARWDGNTWAPMSGLNGPASSFTTYEGDLIAVGSFNQAGGHPAPYIARWDGSEWSPFGTRKVDLDGVVVWNDTLIANACRKEVHRSPARPSAL